MAFQTKSANKFENCQVACYFATPIFAQLAIMSSSTHNNHSLKTSSFKFIPMRTFS